MCVDDPTEAEFADYVFGDQLFWRRIAEGNFFREIITDWRYIVTQKRKSMAFKSIFSSAQNGNFNAAKFLLDEPWSRHPTKSKKASTEEAYDASIKDSLSTSVKEDFERLLSSSSTTSGNA
jgi:hypothetical protein